MRIASVIHRRDWTDSRITDSLRRRGHAVDHVCPPDGDTLPDPSSIDGAVVGGGSVSVWRAADVPFVAAEIAWARDLVDRGHRYLGLCLGSQILAAAYGCSSAARTDGRAEFGFHAIEPTAAGRDLFGDLDTVYQVHVEASTCLPDGAVHLARSEWFEYQAFRIGARAYGLQFHPDARVDQIETWWHDNAGYRDRPGAQPLAEQLADAERLEPARAAFVERLLDRWLAD